MSTLPAGPVALPQRRSAFRGTALRSAAARPVARPAAAVTASGETVNSAWLAPRASAAADEVTTGAAAAPTTRVTRNKNMAALQAGYLFPEIAKRRRAYQEKNPSAKIISLGIGDTTEPIPAPIAAAMAAAAAGLGTEAGYSGYGAEQGQGALRQALADAFYPGLGVKASELFVSDGSKCDLTRLQLMFGPGKTIALQDPSYPAYVDSSVILGQTNGFNTATSQYGNIVYMPCNPANGFFPNLAAAEKADLIFFCSPNNPTGNAATRAQLTELVAFAKRTGAIIIYDAAYAIYIDRADCPKTIYEIPGAAEVAIETCSFSKYAGFTGVRLGWTVVPEALRYADGAPVIADWNRIMTTCFNGASNVAQAGGLACVQPAGLAAMRDLVTFYKGNAKIIYDALAQLGLAVYGGTDAPYVWVHFPGQNSWDVFTRLLEEANVVTTPGSGFGPAGEGFIRISSFGHRADVEEAVARLVKVLKA